MTRSATRIAILLIAISILALISITVAASAAEPYDAIFASESLNSSQKLSAFAVACGWTPELEEWLAYQQTAELKAAMEANNTTQAAEPGVFDGIMKTFGRKNTEAPVNNSTLVQNKYTTEQDTAYAAKYAAYQETYAANYQATSAFAGGGSGTASDPYIITTRAQLEAIADDLSAYYKLGNDIDLGGEVIPWTPIGSGSTQFTGTLDGDGYIISRMVITNPGIYIGLFATLNGATITSLGIKDSSIDVTGQGNGDTNVGIIAGSGIGSTISSCYVDGGIIITDGRPYCGLIIGSSGHKEIIQDCYVRGGSITTMIAAGMTSSSGTIIDRCWCSATVTGKPGQYSIGGSIGSFANGGATFRNCVALSPSVSCYNSNYIGRVVGDPNQLPYSFENNYAAAEMLVNGVSTTGTTTDKNGANVDASTYHTQAFWQSTMGWDFTNIWYWDTVEQLPKLRAFLPKGPTITSVVATPTTGGATTQITLAATVTDATSYQWQSSADGGTTWTDITGATTATASWTPGTPGTYQVQLLATNSDGTTTSDPVTVTIYDVPVVTATLAPTAGPQQQQLTLTGSVTDPAPGTTTYQWQSAPAETGTWTDITGATTLTYQYAYDGAAGTTYYRLAATGVGGTAYSAAASYTAYAAPTVTATVTPQTGPLTQSVTLAATVTDPGPGETTYQWQHRTGTTGDWQTIGGGITNPYTYAFTGTAGIHQFRMAATGTGGTAYSAAVSYTAVAAPVISAATVTPATGTYPLTITYSAVATDTTGYQWQMSANSGSTWTNISTTATGQYTHQITGTYLWRVTATGIGGSTTSETITITVTSPPPAYTEVSVSPLAGALDQEFTLAATASDTTGYQWQSAPAGSTSWTNVATGATAAYTFPAGTTEGTYQIRVVATGPGGSMTSDPVNVVLSDYAPGILSVSVTPVTGDVPLTVTLSATATNNPAYQWQLLSGAVWTNITTGATASYTFANVGTYQVRVVVTNEFGSATSAVQTVTATPPVPVITQASVSPTSGAVPLTVSLSAAATNSPTYTWDLQQGSAWTTIATGPVGSYTFGADVPTGQYDIRVTASNAYGIDTEVFTVSIVGIPTVQIVSPADGSEYAAGRSITFTAQSSGSVVYEWSFGDGTTAVGQTVQHAYQGLGSYTTRVTASNAAGSASASVRITVVEVMDILLTVDSVSSTGATLKAEIEEPDVPAGTKMWFEVYGTQGQVIYESSKLAYVSPITTATVSGMPMLSGQSYTVRAYADGYAPSNRQQITLLSAVAVPYQTVGMAWVDGGLSRDPFNVSAWQAQFPAVYGDVMGGGDLGITIATAVIMMFILVALWLRQQDTTIPMILGLIMGLWLAVLVPEEFKAVGYTLTIICVVALFYQLWKNK